MDSKIISLKIKEIRNILNLTQKRYTILQKSVMYP